MTDDIAEIARQLGERAEEVCRRYLPAGRREGACWRVGDLHNTPGRSLFVRLDGPSSGARSRGRWRDMATGEYGDLIDLIRAACGYSSLADALDEARAILRIPRASKASGAHTSDSYGDTRTSYNSAAAIRRMIAASTPIVGTLAETYLRSRDLEPSTGRDGLRFHPACAYRDSQTGRFSRHAAMLGLVTNLAGQIMGVHRTYLSCDGAGKAQVENPRRSLGAIRGNGVRFGDVIDVAAAGEGIETLLAIRTLLPNLPALAALSASNLAALALPMSLRRLYIALDRDAAGARALENLSTRAKDVGIQPILLRPLAKDFNADLIAMGRDAALGNLCRQLVCDDAQRLLCIPPRVQGVRHAEV